MFINKEIIIIALLIGIFIYLSKTTPMVHTPKKRQMMGNDGMWGWKNYIYGGGIFLIVIFLLSMGAKYHVNILWFMSKIPFIGSFFVMKNQGGGGLGQDIIDSTSFQGKLNMEGGNNDVNEYTDADFGYSDDDDDVSIFSN